LYIAFGYWLIAIGHELFIGKFHHKGKTMIALIRLVVGDWLLANSYWPVAISNTYRL
jgi:fucose permease